MAEPQYTGLLAIIYYWQSLEAGILALFAGILAFLIGKQQAESVRSQTAYLIAENKRSLARRGYVATTMLDGLLDAIKDSLVAVRNFSSSVNNPNGEALVHESLKQQVKDVDLTLFWSDLGQCNSDTVRNFFNLETRIKQLKTYDNNNAVRIRSQIADIDNIIKFLNEELASQRARANSVLK